MYGLGYLFISHDLGAVLHLCDEVAVMYLGQFVERAPREALFAEPLHPHTWALISAVPRLGRRGGCAGRLRVAGDPPSPIDPPAGYRLAGRCAFAIALCNAEMPPLHTIGRAHVARCHLVGDDGPVPHRPAAQ